MRAVLESIADHRDDQRELAPPTSAGEEPTQLSGTAAVEGARLHGDDAVNGFHPKPARPVFAAAAAANARRVLQPRQPQLLLFAAGFGLTNVHRHQASGTRCVPVTCRWLGGQIWTSATTPLAPVTAKS